MGSRGIASDLQGHLSSQVHDVSVDQEEAREAVALHKAKLLIQALFGVSALLGGPPAF